MKLKFFLSDPTSSLERPLFMVPVSAGFPSPADDYLEGHLDLNQKLIDNATSTYYVKVEGESMINAGIHSGDLMIVDRSKEATNRSVVIAIINGEFTVKRIQKTNGKIILEPDNKNYQPIEINENMNFEIWGVVTYVIHPV